MWKILAVVLWAGIPFCGQPLRGQAPGVGVDPSHNQKQQPKLATGQPKEEQRGTKESPFIIETHDRPDSPKEAAKHKTENDTKEYRDRWTFRLAVAYTIFTGLLVSIGAGGVYAALRTLKAIEAQVAITKVQASLISPRLHDEGIRVSNLETDKQPRFFVKFMNGSPTAAKKVTIHMWIKSEVPIRTVAEWSREQIVTIPANSNREYPITWPVILTSEIIEGINKDTPLHVGGRYNIEGEEPTEYCYKYNPDCKKGNDIPMFLPCDFTPGTTVTVMVAVPTGWLTLESKPPTVKIEGPSEPPAN